MTSLRRPNFCHRRAEGIQLCSSQQPRSHWAFSTALWRNSQLRVARANGTVLRRRSLPIASSSRSMWFSNGGQRTRRRFDLLLCNSSGHKHTNTENHVDNASTVEKEDSGFLPHGWPTVVIALFGLGFLLGPPVDGIHSRVQLQIYDNGAIELFGLQTNIWVPLVLGLFYSSAGLMQLALDRKFSTKGFIPTASLTKVFASFVSVTVLLEISAEMYRAGVPSNIEGFILFFFAQLNWLLLENTWWGFGLASFVAVMAPLAEIPIMKLFGLWHYPRADINLFDEGLVSWVICCYFFYTPSISNLARWLSSSQKRLSLKL